MEYFIQIVWFALLLVTGITDVMWRRIPVVLLVLLIAFPFVEFWLGFSALVWQEMLIGASVVGGMVLFLYLLTKRKGIGEADIFLAAFIGLSFGWTRGLLVFSLGNFLGLLIMTLLFPFFSWKQLREVPLGTFLVLAVFIDRHWQLSQMVLDWMSFGNW